MDAASGQCISIFLVQSTYTKCQKNEVYSYNSCICVNGYTRDSYGVCKLIEDHHDKEKEKCPSPSYYNGATCVCPLGYGFDPYNNC